MNFRSFALLAAIVLGSAATDSAAQKSFQTHPGTPDKPYVPLKKCWEYTFESPGRASVSAENGSVFVAENGGSIRSLNSRTSSVNWITELGGGSSEIAAVPTLGVAVVTSRVPHSALSGAILRLLSAESGLVKYSTSFPAAGDLHLVSVGSRLIVVDQNGEINAFDASTGERFWKLNLSGKVTSPAVVSGDVLAAATDDKKITVISVNDGKILSTISVETIVTAMAIDENSVIVAGDERGLVRSYRGGSAYVIWSFKSGGRVGTVSITPQGILVGSFDNFLYLLSNYSGDVKWKRRLDGRISSRPVLYQGTVMAASSTDEEAQVLDLANGKPVDRVPFGKERYMISEPVLADRNIAIFTLVDSIAAYSPARCVENEKSGSAAAR